MARKADRKQTKALYRKIKANPGHRPGRIARLLGLDNKTVMRALPQLEERGDSLEEDDTGRLPWFGRRKG